MGTNPLGKLAITCLLVAALSPVMLRADTVWIQSGKNPLALENVKVTGVQGDQIQFTTASGNQTRKPLKQVPQIHLDDEPALNAAEDAFVKGDWSAASDGYHKVMQATTRDWVKSRASLRLIESAEHAGNFPDAVAGFIDLLQRSPSSANDHKPAVPKNASQLDPSIAEVKQAATQPKLSAEQKTVLLNYLVEMYTAKGDPASAAAVMQQLGQLAPGEANSAESRKIQADVKLTQARQQIGQKQYAQAIQTLDASGGAFTDAAQQAEALYLIAQAKEAGAKPDDAEQWKDAALAYMRVVANFKGVEGKPHVADALLRTAAIEEKLKNAKEALALYKQVSAEFKGSPAAAQADQDAARLAAAPAANG